VQVPDSLIYEVTEEGKPIYYKGYKDVLNKTKTHEKIITESQLQAALKALLTAIAFGVKKVIWIFTKEKLVFIATSQLPWLTHD
jgi:hypothetical protein